MGNNDHQSSHGSERIKVFRSALFLASLTIILEYHHVLIWLDAVMLSIVPGFASHVPKPGPAKALVFTIQEGLFETKFMSRSPIDRKALKELLNKLVKSFPKVKVLAIDYDLSPNNYNLHSSKEKSECVFANLTEENEQRILEDFLVELHEERKIQIVLIKHIPVKNPALCECKLRWQQEKRNQGIMFGHPNLIHLGLLLGPVIKYSEYTIYKDSFSAIVATAEKGEKSCNHLEDSAHQNLSHASFQSINYLKNYKEGTVRVCPLDDENKFNQCKEDWPKVGVENIHEVEVAFVGGAYGKDDTYITPLGYLPGVIIQAHVYASMAEQGWAIQWGARLVWLFDIILGFLVGTVFHNIWSKFHGKEKDKKKEKAKKPEFAPKVIWATLNFIILILVLFLLILMAAHLLPLGLWINPVVVVIGLFIHSYVAAVTLADNPSATSTVSAPSLLFGIPSPIPEKWELIFHGMLKIAAFWITIGLAVYMLITHH